MTHPQQEPATSLSDELNKNGAEHGVVRNPGESDEAYADRIINAIDARVQTLWEAQDTICTLLVAAEDSQ